MNQRALIFTFVTAIPLLMSVHSRAADSPPPPLRPPAVPLVTTDPYFSVWSFDDHLNDGDTHHWTGKPQTLLSLVRIDGKAYRLAGDCTEAAAFYHQVLGFDQDFAAAGFTLWEGAG